MTRYIILLASVLGLLTACSGKSETEHTIRRTIPKEILLSSPRSAAVATATAPAAAALELSPAPIGAMKRTSPAEVPPQRIVIPDIKLDAPVEPMAWRNVQQDNLTITEWDLPADAAGYQVGSAFPGQPGNTVISGHHNIEGRVFENLRRLDPGDPIDLYTEENVFRYVVSDRFLLRELDASPGQRRQNAQWIGPTADERLTLVTCWPPTGSAYRLIVIAKPAGLAALSGQVNSER